MTLDHVRGVCFATPGARRTPCALAWRGVAIDSVLRRAKRHASVGVVPAGCRGAAPAMLPCPAGQFLPCAGVFVETQLIEGQENHAIQYFA